MARPSTGTKLAARSRSSSMAFSTSASSILRSSISTSRSLYCPSSNSGSTSNVARNFTGPLSAKSTLSTCGCVTGTILFSVTARSICSGTSDCSTSLLMSSANRRRISVTGAFPGRNPGTRATRANSRATRSTAFCTVFGGDFQFQLAPASRFTHRRVFAFAGCVVSMIGYDSRTARMFVLLLFAASRSGKRKRERTASGVQRNKSIGESICGVNLDLTLELERYIVTP